MIITTKTCLNCADLTQANHAGCDNCMKANALAIFQKMTDMKIRLENSKSDSNSKEPIKFTILSIPNLRELRIQFMLNFNREMKHYLHKKGTAKNKSLSYKVLSACGSEQRNLLGKIFPGSVRGGLTCRSFADDLKAYAVGKSSQESFQLKSIAANLIAAGNQQDLLITILAMGGAGMVPQEFAIDLIDEYVIIPFQHSIETLPEGQRILIHGGNLLHSVVYEIVRRDDGFFNFSIFDTSLSPFPKGFEMVFQKISPSSIRDRRFLLTLFHPQAGLSPDGSLSEFETTTMEPIYKTIETHLQKTASEEARFNNQTWGSCGASSILAFLETRLPHRVFEEFQKYLNESSVKKLTLQEAAAPSLFTSAFKTLMNWENGNY